MAIIEQWLDVVGYEGLYQISSLGRVKTIQREFYLKSALINVKERIRKNQIDNYGYEFVMLSKKGKPSPHKIHKLVAIAFLGHKKSGYNEVVHHKDHNKTNNTVSNLEITTQRENTSMRDSKFKYTSKYTGVSLAKRTKKWLAHIRINGKSKHLGSFSKETDARDAYIKAKNNICEDKLCAL